MYKNIPGGIIHGSEKLGKSKFLLKMEQIKKMEWINTLQLYVYPVMRVNKPQLCVNKWMHPTT